MARHFQMIRHGTEESGSGEDKAGYPFALVLRIRVLQVVCGISTLLMGAVALIEEKTPFNLGMGMPAGFSTILAAANNIYSSRGFDGYQPSSYKASGLWVKCRILGPTYKLAVINVVLWSLAAALQLALTTNTLTAVLFITDHKPAPTKTLLASIELVLSMCVAISLVPVLWVDCNYDPDCQEPPDLAHSNTGTAVSMVTISQTAPAL